MTTNRFDGEAVSVVQAGYVGQAQHSCTVINNYYGASDHKTESVMDLPSPLLEHRARAEALEETSRFVAAEAEYRKVFEIERNIHDPGCDVTLRTRRKIAILLSHQARYREAEMEYREISIIQRDTLGERHRDTLQTRGSLVLMLHLQDFNLAAEVEARTIAEFQLETFGSADPETVETHRAIEFLLATQGEWSLAESSCRTLLEKHRRTLAPNHPYILDAHDRIATFLSMRGRLCEAERERRHLLKLQRHLGHCHPEVARNVVYLYNLLEAQNKPLDSFNHLVDTLDYHMPCRDTWNHVVDREKVVSRLRAMRLQSRADSELPVDDGGDVVR